MERATLVSLKGFLFGELDLAYFSRGGHRMALNQNFLLKNLKGQSKTSQSNFVMLKNLKGGMKNEKII